MKFKTKKAGPNSEGPAAPRKTLASSVPAVTNAVDRARNRAKERVPDPPDPIMLDSAYEAEAAGLCVTPVREDGSKSPAGQWKRRQKRRTTPEEIYKLFRYTTVFGMGIVCGEVSGNLEMLEFETLRVWRAFKKRAKEAGLFGLVVKVRDGYCERSPGGGIHLLYRCPEIAGNTKLASDANKQVLIETRGEGGFVIVAPSYGPVHPSWKPWVLKLGGFDSIVTITPEERDELWALARSFDRTPLKAAARPKPGKNEPRGDRPGDVFSATTRWSEILEAHGWTLVSQQDGESFWRRPGKSIGVSATTNYQGSDLLYVFSTSTDFEAQQSYSKFGAYTTLEHDGDFAAATRTLAQEQLSGSGEHETLQSDTDVEHGVSPAAPVTAASGAPRFEEAAMYGLAGEIVRTIEPQTEAAAVALLVTVLACFGSAVGSGPHLEIEGARHGCNVFFVLVGETSKGRKGTSLAQVMRIFRLADDEWARLRYKRGGLSSGEGLITAVRDRVVKQEPVREGRQVVGYHEVETDPGEPDKRLLVVEEEFAAVLRVARRDGNSLSAVLRMAWDGGDLQTLTRNSPLRATGTHISALGHTTKDELICNLDKVEAASGFANRFCWVSVSRSKSLPFGGSLTELEIARLADRVGDALECGRQLDRITFDAEARERWIERYPSLSEGKPGLLGAMIGRAEAQTIRLALLYAVIDGSKKIRLEHLDAALALWAYCESSARWIFGERLGDPTADALLAALRAAPNGLTRTELHNVLGRHAHASELTRALGSLHAGDHARFVSEPSAGGRPGERWYAVDADTSNPNERNKRKKQKKRTKHKA